MRYPIAGWDLHSETEPLPGTEPDGLRLSRLLQATLAQKPDLEIYIVVWRASLIYALERETLPSFLFPWKSSNRLHPWTHSSSKSVAFESWH